MSLTFKNWASSKSLVSVQCMVVSSKLIMPSIEIIHDEATLLPFVDLEGVFLGRFILVDTDFFIGEERISDFAFLAQGISTCCDNIFYRTINDWHGLRFPALMRPKFRDLQTMVRTDDHHSGRTVLIGVELILPGRFLSHPA